MTKSISMNRLYMEQNLVVGYLAHNPINSFDSKSESMEKSDEIRRNSA
jgi:serine/threonine-protein kinase ULK/ATG1